MKSRKSWTCHKGNKPMSIKRLLSKLSALLSEDRHVQAEKYKSLKKILKALKIEKDDLEENLSETGDSEARDEIETRLKIISAQRKKGIELLKALNKYRNKT